MLWASGMRRSECSNLTVGDVDLDGVGRVVIRTSKTGKPRRAPLDQRAVQHLARWLAKRDRYPVQDGDALWLGRKGRLSSDGVRQVIERRSRESGVTGVSTHSFRRGWCAESLSAGVSQTSVMTAAGWTTATMPGRYTRGVKERLMLDEFARVRRTA